MAGKTTAPIAAVNNQGDASVIYRFHNLDMAGASEAHGANTPQHNCERYLSFVALRSLGVPSENSASPPLYSLNRSYVRAGFELDIRLQDQLFYSYLDGITETVSRGTLLPESTETREGFQGLFQFASAYGD